MRFNVISPNTTEDLLKSISEYQDKNFRFGAGYTDLLLEIKKQPDESLTVINLVGLNDDDFTSIKRIDGGFRVGALATVGKVAFNRELQQSFPVLTKAASKLASPQIRQVATVGGNICTASPAGDVACALVALEAQCEIMNAAGNLRIVPITDFFLDVRKIDLKKDEILRSVVVPTTDKAVKTYSDFIKIGTRRSMECSVVSLAYHIQVDEKDQVTKAGIAIGSMAPTIKLVTSACEYLHGKNISSFGSSESENFASKVLEYASPISDIRASAWYRKEVLFNISRGIFENRAT